MAQRESLPARVRRAFRLDLGRRRSREAEVDDEIRFHLEQRIEELAAAGWTRERAEAEALARFGPLQESRTQLLESARARDEVLTMFDRFETLLQDVRFAARQITRAPGLTLAVVLTFALGIGANATMFGVIDRLLLRPPRYVVHPETIVQIAYGTAGKDLSQYTVNYPLFRALRDRAQGFTDVTASYALQLPIGRGESAQSANGLAITGNYFALLGAKAMLGRVIRSDDCLEPVGNAVVVVSHDYWETHFAGDARAIGKTVDIGNRKFTIVGVTPPGFVGLGIDGPDMWLPMTAAGSMLDVRSYLTAGAGSWLVVHARERVGVPPERAAEDAMRVARDAVPQAWFTGKSWRFGAVPIMALRGSGQGVSSAVTKLLGAMSIVVLLIACANVANLLLARGLRRRQEIAVRLALGVTRERLMAHLLTESVLLALLGGLAAMLVAYWGGGIVMRTLFNDLSFHGSLVDLRVMTFTAVVTIVTGLLTGVLPALEVSRPELSSALKAGSQDVGGQRSRTRATLLVVQTALSLVLLFGAGLFVRSLARLGTMRLGVDVDKVIVGSMNLPAVGRSSRELDQIFQRALERVAQVPGVAAAAVAATVPFGQSFGASITLPRRDSLVHADAMLNIVTPDYFKTLGAHLLSGRDFTSHDDEGAPPVMIVNEMFATRYWGSRSPIGECVRGGNDSLPCVEIVGVVENVRRQSIFEDSSGFIYLPMAQRRGSLTSRQLIARVDRGNPAAVVESVRLAMQTAAPQLPYAGVELMANDPTVRAGLRPFRLGASMFGAFGILAIALAAVGIYGVVSYNVGQRTREMGVRIALGAQRANVAGLVLREGLVVGVIGTMIGAGIAMLGAKFVGPLLYDEAPRDPVVLLTVAAILIATACVACLVPAWRAVKTDPITALRSE